MNGIKCMHTSHIQVDLYLSEMDNSIGIVLDWSWQPSFNSYFLNLLSTWTYFSQLTDWLLIMSIHYYNSMRVTQIFQYSHKAMTIAGTKPSVDTVALNIFIFLHLALLLTNRYGCVYIYNKNSRFYAYNITDQGLIKGVNYLIWYAWLVVD